MTDQTTIAEAIEHYLLDRRYFTNLVYHEDQWGRHTNASISVSLSKRKLQHIIVTIGHTMGDDVIRAEVIHVKHKLGSPSYHTAKTIELSEPDSINILIDTVAKLINKA